MHPYGETLHAYLFECDGEGLFAVSLDETGRNIPRDSCPEGWRLREPFELGVHAAVPIAISPEPLLRGIRRYGYYVWRQGRTRGTSQ
jgi:hypothetical protein